MAQMSSFGNVSFSTITFSIFSCFFSEKEKKSPCRIEGKKSAHKYGRNEANMELYWKQAIRKTMDLWRRITDTSDWEKQTGGTSNDGCRNQ